MFRESALRRVGAAPAQLPPALDELRNKWLRNCLHQNKNEQPVVFFTNRK